MYYECLNMYGGTKEEGFAKEQRNLIWLFKNKNIKQKKKKKRNKYIIRARVILKVTERYSCQVSPVSHWSGTVTLLLMVNIQAEMKC